MSNNNRSINKSRRAWTETWAIYVFTSICFIGAFSRLTHGRFVPRFYEYQIDHAPDNGSTQANIIPLMDILIGSGALWRPGQRIAIILGTLFITMGTYLQFSTGKQYGLDLIHLAIGLQAIGQTL